MFSPVRKEMDFLGLKDMESSGKLVYLLVRSIQSGRINRYRLYYYIENE